MADKEYLSPKEVEEIYGYKRGTLANWRCQGIGPAYIKSGRKIMYKVTVIDHWLYSQRVLTADFQEEDLECHFESTIKNEEVF